MLSIKVFHRPLQPANPQRGLTTPKISLVALLSIFSFAIDGSTASPFAVKRDNVALPASVSHVNTPHYGTIGITGRMPGYLLGIPINTAKNLSTISSGGDEMTGHQLTALAPKPVVSALGSPIVAISSSINAATASTSSSFFDGDDDNDAPIPEYDDPGYRIKCINSSPDAPGDGTDEDFKEAFECWFYHRTRCFSGDLTSLDPKCKHDCVCEKNDWGSYDGTTKGNMGAGLGGICESRPNPHYSYEDGGCDPSA